MTEIDNKVIVQGYSNYILYEDGRVYNKKWKRFLRTTELFDGKYRTIRMVSDDGKLRRFYIHVLLKKYFGVKVPEIIGEKHKPVKEYENLYEVYTNGRIYSCITCKFLKPTDYNGSKYITLVKDGVKRSVKVANVVLATFTNNCDWKDRIKFKDNDKSNCNLNNLTVIGK